MRRKLLMTYIVIIAITVIACGVTFWSKGYGYIDEHNVQLYLNEAEILKELYVTSDLTDEMFVEKYSEAYQIRITLINADGEVVSDSATDEGLDSHDNREEVRKALRGETASATRYSNTMKMEYLYSAVPVEIDGELVVFRTSVPLEELQVVNRSMILSAISSLVIAGLAALLIAYVFSNYIINPIDDITKVAEDISGGNYGGKIYTRQDDQIGRLAGSFNKMSLDLKKTVESLTNRNTELEAILGSMTNAVVAIDETNKILFSNESFRELFELSKDEKIKGQEIYAFVRSSLILDSIDAVRKSEQMYTQEGSLFISSEKMIRILGTPLNEKEYKTFGVLLVITDITELKKLENMRSDFVSNVTHELKTPLTSIRGFVDTLKNGALNDEKVARRFLDIIDVESERLFTLIQDILLLSEIENKREYEAYTCDIPQTVLEVVELLRGKTGENVELIYEIAPGIAPLGANPDRMKQLLINLVDNAIKSTESGCVKISTAQIGQNLEISIKDTGIGIPPDALDRIFERFYRVDKGRSRKQGGTGLGLSIVKHIIELYEGTIEVKSELGTGTEFMIRFPYR